MNIPLLCVALLALLTIAAGFRVSMARASTGIVQGYPDDPSNILHKAVRAHGNTVEYAPVIALLIYILGAYNPPFWLVICMVLVTVARYMIYFGLLLSPTINKPHPLRFLGALLTYIFGIVLAVYLAWVALVA
ncbi:MAPEG family protein [Haliea sp. E17]|uniref:MAPEG family protein n=1 Tax=Haliea sp. E17 TaxID=3401576 RepID=UPI003AAD2549